MTSDHLGSPRVITDQTGAVQSRRDFMPYGEEAMIGTGPRAVGQGYTDGDSTRQKFTGYERDAETDLDFAQARVYSSKLGRFTSVDLYKIVAEVQRLEVVEKSDKLRSFLMKAQQWNLYQYALNNAQKYTDPNGENVVIKGTSKEQERALNSFKKIVGEERWKLIDMKVVDGNTILSIDSKKISAFSKIGDTNNNREFSKGMAELLLPNKINTEFYVRESFTNILGKKVDLNTTTYNGALTVSGANAPAHTIQINVHPEADKIINKGSKSESNGVCMMSDCNPIRATFDDIVGHEFGHALDRQRQLGGTSMGARDAVFEPRWKVFENAIRERNPRDSQRRVVH